MLFTFVIGIGAHAFNLRVLAHELAHDRGALMASVAHEHASADRDLQVNPDDDSSSNTEHKLLHALSHCEHFPCSAFHIFQKPSVRTVPMLPPLLTLLPAELESLFRPPRTTSPI